MNVKILSAIAVAASVGVAAPASAQTFTGFTAGCFTTTSCTPTTGISNTGGLGGLTYVSGAFNQSILNGSLGLGGTSDNLGSFTIGTSNITYDGELFDLLVTFTSPPGAQQGAFTADLTGTVRGLNNGGVFLDFANNSNNPLLLSYTGGQFQFWVNDINISSFSAAQILSGGIRAVPEPATWAMMLLGFGAIGLAMRSRRQPALAQLA